MAATINTIQTDPGKMIQVTIPWTSSAGGAYTEVISVTGWLTQVEFVPGTSGSQPTDLYDVTLPDANSYDCLAGTGANLSNTTTTRKSPCVNATDGTNNSVVPVYLSGAVTLTVANGGNAKGGTVILWVRG